MMNCALHKLAVAPTAAYGGFHIPLFDIFFTQLALCGSSGGLPIQIGNLIQRTKMVFGGAVAFQTPTHAVGLGVIDDLHVIDVSMAGNAANASIYVHRMVEVNVVGSFMNPNPGDWIACFPRFPYGTEFGTLRLNLCVTVHASLCAGHVGVRRFFNPCMAVTTIHTELIDVKRVVEGDRLRRLVADACVFWGKVVGHSGYNTGNDDRDTDQYFDW